MGRRHGLGFAGILALAAASAAAAPDPVAQGRAALAAAREAYRAVPALEDTLTYTVKAPGAKPEPGRLDVRLGAGNGISVEDPLLRAVAVGPVFYLTKSDAPTKFVERPYAGDFAATLESVVGKGSLFEPVQVAMRLGRDLDACVDRLRFNQLSALRIDGFGEAAGASGGTVDEVRLVADNGRAEARLDPRTHFFSSLHMAFTPTGAPAGVTIEIDARFAPRVLPASASVVAFDRGSRRAVPGLADLDSDRLPLGKPAPAFDLPSAAGGRVTLAELKGRVVLVDFWATWCAPCWQALAAAQRVHEWAAAKKLPLTVVAVDTMERFPTEAERAARVRELLAARGLTMPVALDAGTATFDAFGSPGLPSSALIAADGTGVKVHQGLFPDLEAALEREAEIALAVARPKTR